MARWYPRRRRRRQPSVGKFLKGKMLGIIFIGLAVLIAGLFTYAMSIIPTYYVYYDSANSIIGTGTTLPTNATGVDVKLIAGIVVWGAEVLLVVSAVRRLGIRI
ncbi:MAG: hypothetical protein J7K21_05440 [Desulfurococcales archaeon]|nr:hypothetical protein [Desulfurococcales archaeon]